MTRVSCPGKVFLFGEYAVLQGAPAWVGAIGPRFSVEDSGLNQFPFAPQSPAGRLWNDSAQWSGSWQDPHQGRGGFGASSAQFLLTAKRLDPTASLECILERYHALHTNEEVPPSGADIAAQGQGGVVRYVKHAAVTNSPLALDFDRVLLFTATPIAGRKINTHEHLARLGKAFFHEYAPTLQQLKAILHDVDQTIAREGSFDTDATAQTMRAYAETLHAAGLEASSATEDRLALSALPQVAAVKGTGAGLADAVWILLAAGTSPVVRQQTIDAAVKRGLVPVALTSWETGLREDGP